MITCEVTESHGVTVNVPALRDCVELVADRPHQVAEGPVRPGGCAVVEVEAEAALPPALPGLDGRLAARDLGLGVLQEHLVCRPHDVVDVDDAAQVGNNPTSCLKAGSGTVLRRASQWRWNLISPEVISWVMVW